MDTRKFQLDVPGTPVEDYARNVSVMHSMAGEGDAIHERGWRGRAKPEGVAHQERVLLLLAATGVFWPS